MTRDIFHILIKGFDVKLWFKWTIAVLFILAPTHWIYSGISYPKANPIHNNSSFDFTNSLMSTGGIIVNEFSNGPNGSKEWIELLVVGDPANPTAPVDLTGWIIDDNNGDFEGSNNTGIATGYISLDASFNAVAPGSLIVIYNQNDVDLNLPPDDPTDADGDGVYILPADHSSVDGCNTRPTTSDTSYLPCTLIAGNWSRLLMRNSGDAVQVRQPDGTFYHGFSYGNVTNPFPTFPSGTSSFNVGSGGTGSTFSLQCSDWESDTEYIKVNASGRTPGEPNSADNEILIHNISIGDFDYVNLAAAGNCIKDIDGDLVIDSDDLDDDNDGITDENELRCDQPTVANSSSGTGVYQDQLYLFNWDGADFTDGLQTGDTQTFNLPDGLTIQATFTEVTLTGGGASINTADFEASIGAYLHNLYNTPGTAESFYGNSNTTSMTVTVYFSATKNGEPFRLDLLALDSENTDVSTNEDWAVTTDGDAWQLLEQYNTGGTWTGVGTQTVTTTDTDQSNGNSIYYSPDANELTFSINSLGANTQAFALGLYLVCDSDDDGIPNFLDLDSDNDGCADFMDGAGTFDESNGVAASGNLSDGNGDMVTDNLGNTVGNVPNVDLGIPVIAGTGQQIGDSQDPNEQSTACCGGGEICLPITFIRK